MDGMLPFNDDGNGLYCTGCQTVKAVDRFSKNRAQKTGRANWCKDCLRGLYTSREYLEHRKQWRINRPAETLLNETRNRARRAGVPFDLTVDDLVIPEVCPVLGIELRWEAGGRTDQTPTVDRINPTKGYVRGNVAVVSWRANRLKSDCDDPCVFDAIAAYIRRHQA